MGKPYKHPDLSAADRVLDTAFKYAAERNNLAILLNRDNLDRQEIQIIKRIQTRNMEVISFRRSDGSTGLATEHEFYDLPEVK